MLRNKDNKLFVKVNDLQRHFKNLKAVAGIRFGIYRGEIFALLGPYGGDDFYPDLVTRRKGDENPAFAAGHAGLFL